MENLPERRKGLADNLASAFCSAAEFLSDTKIAGVSVGTLTIFAAVIAAGYAYAYVDTFLFMLFLFVGILGGQFTHILICKREGLRDYLLTTGLRFAGLGAGFWIG